MKTSSPKSHTPLSCASAGRVRLGPLESDMAETSTKVVDPVCGMTIDRDAAIIVVHAGASHHFCDVACAETFHQEPDRWPSQPDRVPLGHTH